jgi:hypothetical protein
MSTFNNMALYSNGPNFDILMVSKLDVNKRACSQKKKRLMVNLLVQRNIKVLKLFFKQYFISSISVQTFVPLNFYSQLYALGNKKVDTVAIVHRKGEQSKELESSSEAAQLNLV